MSTAKGENKRNQAEPEVKTITSDELKRFLLEALLALQDKNYDAAKKAMSNYEGFESGNISKSRAPMKWRISI